jgi:F0F1-type ATP synthase assembly protein I
MQRIRASYDAHHIALRAVLGETGFTGVVIVLLATGIGLLLDFQFIRLHPIFSTGLLLLSVPVSLFWTIRRTLMSMDQKPNPDYMRNLALATVAGQAGCSTVVLVFLALFAGMFLDSRLDTHPVFTIGLVLVAIPVSLYAMIRLMLTSVGSIKLAPLELGSPTGPAKKSIKKENGS